MNEKRLFLEIALTLLRLVGQADAMMQEREKVDE